MDIFRVKTTGIALLLDLYRINIFCCLRLRLSFVPLHSSGETGNNTGTTEIESERMLMGMVESKKTARKSSVDSRVWTGAEQSH